MVKKYVTEVMTFRAIHFDGSEEDLKVAKEFLGDSFLSHELLKESTSPCEPGVYSVKFKEQKKYPKVITLQPGEWLVERRKNDYFLTANSSFFEEVCLPI